MLTRKYDHHLRGLPVVIVSTAVAIAIFIIANALNGTL